ncbi:MAG TPA: hypothetical protein VK943_16865 [Arenibaculum sp.]|nr:hypothetical protein [Arenibaculum sp.]
MANPLDRERDRVFAENEAAHLIDEISLRAGRAGVPVEAALAALAAAAVGLAAKHGLQRQLDLMVRMFRRRGALKLASPPKRTEH